MKSCEIFTGSKEGPLHFSPTYKIDRNTIKYAFDETLECIQKQEDREQTIVVDFVDRISENFRRKIHGMRKVRLGYDDC